MLRYANIRAVSARSIISRRASLFAMPARNMRSSVQVNSLKDISPAEAFALVESGQTYLDVRTPEEFVAGHAPNAINIPIFVRHPDGMVPNPGFESAVHEAIPDSSSELVVGCKSGARSARACGVLGQAYPNLSNLIGGFDAWAASGLPVTK